MLNIEEIQTALLNLTTISKNWEITNSDNLLLNFDQI